VGPLDQNDWIGPVVSELPHAERASWNVLPQLTTELEALDPRNRPNADRPIGSAVLTAQRRICLQLRRHVGDLVGQL
jgi:hypothetical protein